MQKLQVAQDDANQIAAAARRAGEVFGAGGLVVFPTETVYGIGAPVANDKGYRALRQFKGRPDDEPFTVHLPDAAAATRYGKLDDPWMCRILGRFLPGPVTLVVDVSEQEIAASLASMGLTSEHRNRIYHGLTVGLRCPDDAVARAVLGSVSSPVVASSANPRGASPPMDAHAAAKAVGDAAEIVIDGGHCRYAKPSTIVRIIRPTAATPGGLPRFEVLRDGVLDERSIRNLLRWTMLLVCSGNTCRSPMAEGIARKLAASRWGLAPDDLESAGIRIISGGVFTGGGSPASPQAVHAAAQMGIDIAGHRSRPVGPDLVNEVDVIYCMTRSHQQAIIEMMPSAVDKTFLLDEPNDIEDPIGADDEAYERTAAEIAAALERRLKEHWA